MQKRTKYGFWYGFNLAAAILIIFFVLGVPLLFALADFIENVDLSMSLKGPALVAVPTSFDITLQNANARALNAVEFELNYDPSALLITAVVPHTTLCQDQFVITNKVSNASGTALFQCGTTSPFTDTEGTIATIHAVPLKLGTSTVAFGTQTHVLAHDGYGTNATRLTNPLTLDVQ